MPSTGFIRRLAWGLSALAVAWAGLILAAPMLGSAASPAPGGAYASAAVYWVGSLVCHQRPERSFHLAGARLPVCARCTGLYLSGALGVIVGTWRGLRGRAVPWSRWRLLLAAASVPTAATLAAEWLWPSTESGLARAAAAVPLGLAAGVLLAEFAGFRGRLHGCEATRRRA